MESRDVLKIHGTLRRYCTSRVSLRSTLEVQYLLNLPCIFNTSLDSMLYLLNTFYNTKSRLENLILERFFISRNNYLGNFTHTRYDSAVCKYTAVNPNVDNKMISPRIPPSETGLIQKLTEDANMTKQQGMAVLKNQGGR